DNPCCASKTYRISKGKSDIRACTTTAVSSVELLSMTMISTSCSGRGSASFAIECKHFGRILHRLCVHIQIDINISPNDYRCGGCLPLNSALQPRRQESNVGWGVPFLSYAGLEIVGQ